MTSEASIATIINVAATYRKRAADAGVVLLSNHKNSASSDPCQMK
jgi:hypothetical protein